MMLIIVDKRMPDGAKRNLRKYGELIEFATSGITYEAISGHPDIFFCQTPAGLVVAPNTPGHYLALLKENGISYRMGESGVNGKYPGTAGYNAVVNGHTIIHNTALTDQAIPDFLQKNSADNVIHYINVKQGYTRCNLLQLNGNHFLTSDKGIESTLKENGSNVLYVSPQGILLPGFNHGFFGGCCGFWQNNLFIAGSLDLIQEAKKVREFVQSLDISIIELYDGPLYDVGGILQLR
jgi:hypothetical protein